MPTPEQFILGLMLPNGIMEWFNVIAGTGDDDKICIILEEKTYRHWRMKIRERKLFPKILKKSLRPISPTRVIPVQEVVRVVRCLS